MEKLNATSLAKWALLGKLHQEEINSQLENSSVKSELLWHGKGLMTTRLARYLNRNFDIVEFTYHFYDDNENCPEWEDRMAFNNWIDLNGPDIWFISQEEANQEAFEALLDVVKYKKSNKTNSWRWHIFVYESVIFIHWFGRDACGYDHWWIYEPNDEVDCDKIKEMFVRQKGCWCYDN